MADQNKIKRHAALLDQMADTLGIDLEEAAICGAFPMGEISEAVLRCTACSNPETCTQWMKQHPDGAELTPDYCRNREILQALRP